jgi:hypothetical protein
MTHSKLIEYQRARLNYVQYWLNNNKYSTPKWYLIQSRMVDILESSHTHKFAPPPIDAFRTYSYPCFFVAPAHSNTISHLPTDSLILILILKKSSLTDELKRTVINQRDQRYNPPILSFPPLPIRFSHIFMNTHCHHYQILTCAKSSN